MTSTNTPAVSCSCRSSLPLTVPGAPARLVWRRERRAASTQDLFSCQLRRRRGDSRQNRCQLQVRAVAAVREAVGRHAPTDVEYDAVIIGCGMGGLTTATQLAAQGAKVVVLEKYIIPGGSAGHYKRDGYTFDVGSSMMFGFGKEGTTNLITRALANVGKALTTVPDPCQIHYHLPKSQEHPDGLDIKVWRRYEDFVEELSRAFPHERAGIKKLYDECWAVFNALNSLQLKSLEEPRYLLGEFFKHPLACLTLVKYMTGNTGDYARKYIKDPVLLRFIDIECYCWSTVPADFTPMINAGMVFCDRHYGGINYPVGGVGRIAESLEEGLQERGGFVEYKANVREIVMEPAAGGSPSRAVGVRLNDGRVYRGKTIVSNATRWDTFGKLVPDDQLPESEAKFRGRYTKAPSFLTFHLGVKADVLPEGCHCHHIIVEDWQKMEEPRGTLFVSIPTLLDPSLSPPGTHIFHAFTPEWVDDWKGLDSKEYERRKVQVTDDIIKRLEAYFPGLGAATVFREVGTPRTHRRFLNRMDGSYGPIPSRKPLGMLSMPFNRTAIPGLYCVGDSTFPGQGVNAVVFSAFGCAHRILVDLGMQPKLPVIDEGYNALLGAVRDRA